MVVKVPDGIEIIEFRAQTHFQELSQILFTKEVFLLSSVLEALKSVTNLGIKVSCPDGKILRDYLSLDTLPVVPTGFGSHRTGGALFIGLVLSLNVLVSSAFGHESYTVIERIPLSRDF
jgi:hypothetical protein